MWEYIIGGVICIIIWIVNIKPIIEGFHEHILSEIYTHLGLGIYFTLLVINQTIVGMHTIFDIGWLQTIGFILFIPSALLVLGAIITLEHKGKSKTSKSPVFASPQESNILVDTGLYGIVRHPMLLGMVIWSFALIFVFQSITSMILGMIAVFCFGMASKKEDEFNMEKFGENYKEYMKKVPRWNFWKGLSGLRR